MVDTIFFSQFGGLENNFLCNVLRIDGDREDDEIEIINQSPYFYDEQLTYYLQRNHNTFLCLKFKCEIRCN